jgi:WD40 repeat protein
VSLDLAEALVAPRSLIGEHGTTLEADSFVVGIVWLGHQLAAACGDGSVRIIDPGGGVTHSVAVHNGAILAAAPHPDGASLLTGGDDGRLVRIWPSGQMEELAAFGNRWVEHVVASSASGLIACAAGKEVCVLPNDGASTTAHRFSHPSSVGGIALDTKGRRLAVSHYGGASLWWASSPGSPRKPLDWGGSHLSVTFSPDGRFLVTAMQENALHGWRVGDAASFHMSGYPAKIRSLAWAEKGRWLVTAGADRVINWPFIAKDGPMNKRPVEIGPGGLLVSRVSSHPTKDAIAAGYEDGSALLLRRADEKGAVLQVAGGGPVTAIAWSPAGHGVAVGCEDGRLGLLPL